MTLLSGHKSFGLGRQQLAFFGVQLILIKQEMGRNVRHICRLLRQLTQDPESRCLFLAELHAHLHVEIFCSSFEWGSLIKSLKSRAFAQYAPLPSLQSTIACNLFTHNEGASHLIRCLFLCLCKHGENSLSTRWCVALPGSVEVDTHAFTVLNDRKIDEWLEDNETLGLLCVVSKWLEFQILV